MHGFDNGGLRPRRRRRRQFNPDGERLAALRAFTGARLVRAEAISMAEAAERSGSNRCYVKAALTLLASENTTLIQRVVAGHVPLRAAAAQMKRLAQLVAAYRWSSATDRNKFRDLTGLTNNLADHLIHADPAERAEAARALGADVVWDEMILPIIQQDRQSAPAK